MNKRTRLVRLMGGLAIMSAACGSSGSQATSPTPPPTSTPAASAISPNNNASITQNDPATGCAILTGVDAFRGLGFAIKFHWTPASPPNGIAGYEIFVTKVGAPIPALDTMVTTTDFIDTQCNSFVDDANLPSWQWRTRAKDGQGQFGDWAPWATFEFSPCRLNDGTACRAPAGS